MFETTNAIRMEFQENKELDLRDLPASSCGERQCLNMPVADDTAASHLLPLCFMVDETETPPTQTGLCTDYDTVGSGSASAQLLAPLSSDSRARFERLRAKRLQELSEREDERELLECTALNAAALAASTRSTELKECKSPNNSNYYVMKEQRRYTFGTELIIAAIIASVGVCKVRYDAAAADEEKERRSSPQASSFNAAKDASFFESIINELPDSPQVDAVGKQAARRFVVVKANDSLTSIAENIFHDGDLAWLIADLNKRNLKEFMVEGKRVVELKTCQRLDLPFNDEIAAFYRDRCAKNSAGNMVTIVSDGRIDRSMLEKELSFIMCDASRAAD